MPGHGRALADSHDELPVVDASAEELAIDLAPFRALAGAPMAMTAHLLYPAWDPDRPASLVAGDHRRGDPRRDRLRRPAHVRRYRHGGAVGRRWRARAQAALAAGCDLALHCSGERRRMRRSPAPWARWTRPPARLERALARIAGKASTQGYEALAAKRDALLAYA